MVEPAARCVSGQPVRCAEGERLYREWVHFRRLAEHEAASIARDAFLQHIVLCSNVLRSTPGLEDLALGLTAEQINRLLFLLYRQGQGLVTVDWPGA